MRLKIDETRSRIASQQQELASLLAMQRGAAKHRAPLEQAFQAAQAVRRDAEEALARHLGGVNEESFADKLFECTEAAKKAEVALAAFDKQYEAREKTAELRTGIQQSQEALHTLEQRQTVLTHELDQAVAHATTLALVRVLSAYNDLYDVLSADGPTIARMRLTDPILYRKLTVDLTIEQDILFRLLQSDFDPDGLDRRPLLLERQQDIREMLLKLKKGL